MRDQVGQEDGSLVSEGFGVPRQGSPSYKKGPKLSSFGVNLYGKQTDKIIKGPDGGLRGPLEYRPPLGQAGSFRGQEFFKTPERKRVSVPVNPDYSSFSAS